MKATLELAAEFYRLDAVERGVVAFADLATITVEPGPSFHRIRLEPIGSADVDYLRLEFANWVLAAGASAPIVAA
jgi:hypothetical protein